MKEHLESAFVGLIEQHKGIIYKIAHIYGSDPDDRKDLFQEISLNLWKAFPLFKGDSKASTWIYKVALYTAITNYRKHSRRNKHTELFFIESHDLFEDNSETINQQVKTLYLAIDKLSSVDKAIILLVLEERSYGEIGAILGLKPTAVAMRVKRAKDQLTQFMKAK